MNIINFRVNKHINIKYASINPDTGNIKLTSEVYDKLNDEILERLLHETKVKKK